MDPKTKRINARAALTAVLATALLIFVVDGLLILDEFRRWGEFSTGARDLMISFDIFPGILGFVGFRYMFRIYWRKREP